MRNNIKISQGITSLTINDGTKIYSEKTTGLVNGSNTIFNTAYSFIPESVEIFIEGIKLKVIDDYLTMGGNTIILQASPLQNESIMASYKKQI